MGVSGGDDVEGMTKPFSHSKWLLIKKRSQWGHGFEEEKPFVIKEEKGLSHGKVLDRRECRK